MMFKPPALGYNEINHKISWAKRAMKKERQWRLHLIMDVTQNAFSSVAGSLIERNTAWITATED